MYKAESFKLYELIPTEYWHNYGSRRFIFWYVFDPRLLITIDRLRDKYGPAIMNDWKWGGRFQYRGFRPSDCAVGAAFSQHRFGRAADMVFKNVSAEKVRQDILQDPNSYAFEYITSIELETSWLHIDVRNHNKHQNGIKTFTP